MAADLTSPMSETMHAPAEPASPSPRAHRVRFAIVYAALGAVLIAAIVGVAVFATRSINPAPKWSPWKPSGGGQGAAQQIADHIAKAYHLPNGNQLVDVISKAPSITPSKATLPIHYVAIKGTKGSADQVYPVTSTNSVMYSLCGLGTNCEIPGTPSVARGELVRREILELALYTLKYDGGIDNVIAFMPATAGKTAKYVVYLRHNDVAAELKQPLATTLGKKVPLPTALTARETKVIDKTTVPRLYSFSGVAQSQQGDLIFVFTPIPAA